MIYKFLRFNRYMVECESVNFYKRVCQRCVLIDTWWNVNEKEPNMGEELEIVLIDTWWNVNNKDYPIYDNNDSF